MRGMGIVLIGYRGSGKTTVGRKLAQALKVEFVDLDERIIVAEGKTIREIFAEQGEAGFREHEARALAEMLEEKADRVMSLGGGVVERGENREKISASGHRIIYLRCEVDELQRRIAGDPQTTQSRPILTKLGGGRAEIAALLARREPWYRQVAQREIDVTALTVDDVVAELMRRA
jgi:shikimate kinase